MVLGEHGRPQDVLGRHAGAEPGRVTVRAFYPYAKSLGLVIDGGDSLPMAKAHRDGLFEVSTEMAEGAGYQFAVEDYHGNTRVEEDPYRFPPQVSDFDLHLFGEGTHLESYNVLGAHLRTVNGVDGVHFAVWAPNAVRISILGDFNHWDGRHHPMMNRGDSGIWELFLPGLAAGATYKLEIKGRHGFLAEKSDPYAFAAELRPRSASIVWSNEGYGWGDAGWMKQRRQRKWSAEPISVYEVHLGSWMQSSEGDDRFLTYRELANALVPHVKELGFTHVELMPVTEHPYDGSWGYQTIGYYAATSRFGSPDDLKFLIDACHQAGIGVILDWVPAHFPKDSHGLGYFDGSHLYEHSDPRLGEHMDWGTLIFNYGRHEVRNFLLASAMYWADVYHVDGIRVDAVASMIYLDYSREEGEWLPNEFGGRENLAAVDFLKKFNEAIHGKYPGFLTFAEESTAWPMVTRPTYLGGLGFDLKWNMGWMHDTLVYMTKEPIHRKHHHNDITFSLLYAFTENFILPFSHDEVVHGKRSMLSKMPGDSWQQFANLRLLYAYMFAHPGKKLLFMGQEFGQWNEWDSNQSLDWNLLDFEPHRKLQNLVGDLNRVYRKQAALHEIEFAWDGFEWIDVHDADNSVLSFLRKGRDPADTVVCLLNFTPVPREGYRVGVPLPGTYDEILNTDADAYGGSNMGNAGHIPADPIPWQSQENSLLVSLPPLAALFLKPRG